MKILKKIIEFIANVHNDINILVGGIISIFFQPFYIIYQCIIEMVEVWKSEKENGDETEDENADVPQPHHIGFHQTGGEEK